MSLATDIKAAKGYIAGAPERVYTSGQGFHPAIWFDDTALDGTAVTFAQAPIGSIYVYKPSESAAPTLYQKVAAAAANTDWAILQPSHGASVQIKKLSVSDLTTGEKDTGWDLPAKAIVLDVFVDVRTLEATATTKTIDVGLLSSETGGDTDGFLDGISTATPAGLRRGQSAVTTGSNTKFFAANPTRGILLCDHQAGTDVDQDEGLYREKPHLADSVTAKSVVYQLGSAHTELVADIYVHYLLLGQ